MSLLAVLTGKKVSRPPVWFMRQAGRSLPEYRALRQKAGSFWDMCFIPEFTIEATLQPLKRFDLDAAILFSDILTVPKALGQTINFTNGIGPELDEKFVDNLPLFEEETFLERLDPIRQSVSAIRQRLNSDKTLIGFVGGPWTVASYMVEGRKTKNHFKMKCFAYQNTAKLEALLALLVKASCVYLDLQVQAGAQVVQIFESWAQVLPEPYFKKWTLEPLLQIARHMKKKHPTVPLIVFPKDASGFFSYYVSSGLFAGLSLDHTHCLQTTVEHYGSKICLQGGLDPALLCSGGALLEQEVERLCEIFQGKNYIFNLSHGIDPATPLKHIEKTVMRLKQGHF